MKIPIYQVDAFTSTVFSGNPAAVCLLDEWIDDRYLQAIAAENNLSETAYLVPNKTGFDLRWFTPVTEVVLCGHATLASAFVLFEYRNWRADTIRFQTLKSGQLTVTRQDEFLEMDFPAIPAYTVNPSEELNRALGISPVEVCRSAEDLMAVFDSERTVVDLQPDFAAVERLDCLGIIITAQGNQCDFVSRFFAPKIGVPEDPVTGSAHCVLIPYWATVLDKRELHALQVSKRGGELFCRNSDQRVSISGKAALYLEGTIMI